MRAVTAISVLALSLFASAPAFSQAPPATTPATPPAPPMALTSTSFPDGTPIPVKYTQAGPGVAAGEGTSPALTWTNAPAATQSFVLHVHDLDGARNKTTEDQLHWLVWPIPSTTTSLPEGVARGEKLANGAWQVSATGPVYRGPGAPATGPMHHYIFEVYALDNVISVAPTADVFETRTKVMAAMQGHIIGKAVYSGLFRRPN